MVTSTGPIDMCWNVDPYSTGYNELILEFNTISLYGSDCSSTYLEILDGKLKHIMFTNDLYWPENIISNHYPELCMHG